MPPLSLPALPYPEQMTRITRVSIGGRTLKFRHLREIDSLFEGLSEAELKDEKLPYYGELWPASIGLARWMRRTFEFQGKRVLDLGCGVAVAGVTAAIAGAEATMADYFPEALAFAGHNAALNGVSDVRTLLLDWRDVNFCERFDFVLGCDITYERRNHAPILDLLSRCLAPNGVACFSDPGRVTLEPFVAAAGAHGFQVAREEMQIQEAADRVSAIHLLTVRRGDEPASPARPQ